MQPLGQALAQSPQAVHLARPVSASNTSWMWPRKRDGIGSVSCGYWTVMMGFVASRAVMRMPVTRLLKPENVSRMAEARLMVGYLSNSGSFITAPVSRSVNSESGMRIFQERLSRL